MVSNSQLENALALLAATYVARSGQSPDEIVWTAQKFAEFIRTGGR